MSKSSTEDYLAKAAAGVMAVALAASINLLSAWFIMLGLGVAHDQWPRVPAFGFWATWLLTIGISSLAGAIHGGMRVKWKTD